MIGTGNRRAANRTTRDTLADHLARRHGRQLDLDLELNYAPDVVVLTSEGTFYGRDGVRRVEARICREGQRYRRQLVSGEVAFVEWEDGSAETFVIREGRIVAQTVRFGAS